MLDGVAAAIRVLQLPSECCSCNQNAAAAIRVLQLQSECCSCHQSVAAAVRVLQQLSSVSYLSTSNITPLCCWSKIKRLAHTFCTWTVTRIFAYSISAIVQVPVPNLTVISIATIFQYLGWALIATYLGHSSSHHCSESLLEICFRLCRQERNWHINAHNANWKLWSWLTSSSWPCSRYMFASWIWKRIDL